MISVYCLYAYRLKKGKKDKNVKSILQDIPLNTDEVDDRYFKEYAIIYVGTMGSYLIINQLLVSHLNKMSPTERLKNRE